MRRRAWALGEGLVLRRDNDGGLVLVRHGLVVMLLADTAEQGSRLLPELTRVLRELARLDPLERSPRALAGLAIAREARLTDGLWVLETVEGLWLNRQNEDRTWGVLLGGGPGGPWQALMDALTELELEGKQGGGP